MAKKAGVGIHKKYALSDELADFMEKDSASRPEITKALWAYIKENDLNDGRTIHPDDVLSPILGSRPLDMMKMPSKISEHITSE